MAEFRVQSFVRNECTLGAYQHAPVETWTEVSVKFQDEKRSALTIQSINICFCELVFSGCRV
jgi:hypothetical protein